MIWLRVKNMNEKPAQIKKPWASKTLYMALISAVVAFIPPVQNWIAENPTTYGWIVAGIFAAIRLVTKGKIVIT